MFMHCFCLSFSISGEQTKFLFEFPRSRRATLIEVPHIGIVQIGQFLFSGVVLNVVGTVFMWENAMVCYSSTPSNCLDSSLCPSEGGRSPGAELQVVSRVLLKDTGLPSFLFLTERSPK